MSDCPKGACGPGKCDGASPTRPSILCVTLTFLKDRLSLREELAICIPRGNGEPVSLVLVGGGAREVARGTRLYSGISGSKGLYCYIMYMRGKDILYYTKQHRRSCKLLTQLLASILWRIPSRKIRYRSEKILRY